jgi:hypothetical protein
MRRTRPRFQLTIRQLLIAVVFSAVGFAAMLPFRRAGGAGPFLVDTFLVEVPFIAMLWSILTLVLVRRGPIKDWLLRALWSFPACVILGWVLLTSFYADVSALAVVVLDVVALTAFVLILRWVIPSRCPACRWFSLLRDRAADDPDLTAVPNAHWCVFCARRFRRWYRGDWEEVGEKDEVAESGTMR